MYDLEIHQKKLEPDYHRLKTMVKRSIEQEIRNKNFGSRNGNFEKNAVVKNQGTKQRVQRILGDCWQWETNGQCVKGDNCSFRHDTNKRGKFTPSNPVSEFFHAAEWAKIIENPKSQRQTLQVVERLDGLARITSCEKWHPPECLFYKTKSGCRFGEKCSFAHRQSDEQPTKRSKKEWWQKCSGCAEERLIGKKENLSPMNVTIDQGNLGRGVTRNWDISSKRQSSDARQLGCVFQNMTPPKSILPEGHRHAEANPTCKMHKGYCTPYQNSRPKSFARTNLPRVNHISVAPTLQNLRIDL